MKIESLQNERVKNWCKLQEKKYRDQTGLFLVEGTHLVKEALSYGYVVEIITTDNEEYAVPTYHVTTEIMKKISEQASPSSIIAVCKKMEEKMITGSVLLLDGIQDPGNLGTIIRSAVAFNIPNIVLSESCVDLYNSKVIRSTEGMLFLINVIRANLCETIQKLKQDNYSVYGTDVLGGKDVCSVNIQEPLAFVIGSEGKGMSNEVKALCDSFFYIKMNESCESLNAGVSASILMYEINKQRGEG